MYFFFGDDKFSKVGRYSIEGGREQRRMLGSMTDLISLNTVSFSESHFVSMNDLILTMEANMQVLHTLALCG